MTSAQPIGYMNLIRNARYAPLLISHTQTNLSDGLLSVAVIYFANESGAGAAMFGVISFFVTLSRGLLGPVGGVLGDRMNKRTYLIGFEVIRTLLMAALFGLMLVGQTGIWSLMIFGVAISALFAISVPAAKSVIPQLVGKVELKAANALIQTVT